MPLQVEPSHPTTDFVFCANAMKVLTNNQKPARKKKRKQMQVWEERKIPYLVVEVYVPDALRKKYVLRCQ